MPYNDSDKPTCALCGAEVDDAKHAWCFGCRHFICDGHLFDPWGSHEPQDHDFVTEEDGNTL